MTTALSGMNAIRDFCRSIQLASTEATVIMLIKNYGLPAKKMGGVWQSDKGLILDWRKLYIAGKIEVGSQTVYKEDQDLPFPT